MTISAYPLQWPAGWKRCETRKRAKFSRGTSAPSYTPAGESQRYSTRQTSLTIEVATKRVLAELTRFGVKYGDFVISTNLALRLDGMPKTGQGEPRDPGVAVYWNDALGKPKVMAIDIYDRCADNLAAVAATLDAMRAIERHGGAAILERTFTGFTALPPPRSCWEVFGVQRANVRDREELKSLYRRLAMERYPDRGGSQDAIAELNSAYAEAKRQTGWDQ